MATRVRPTSQSKPFRTFRLVKTIPPIAHSLLLNFLFRFLFNFHDLILRIRVCVTEDYLIQIGMIGCLSLNCLKDSLFIGPFLGICCRFVQRWCFANIFFMLHIVKIIDSFFLEAWLMPSLIFLMLMNEKFGRLRMVVLVERSRHRWL